MAQNTSHAVMQQRRESPLEVIAREDAVALGLRWYFTGAPCPHGHIAKRNVSNRDCRGCINERHRARREAGLCADLDKKRYAKDIEGNRTKSRASRLKHIEKRREYDRVRYLKNTERREWQKKQALGWARKNKGKRNYTIAMRRAWIKTATPKWITAEMIAQIKSTYVMAKEIGPGMHVDHIHPLRAANSCGLHVPWNLQIIPATQNIKKGNRYEA